MCVEYALTVRLITKAALYGYGIIFFLRYSLLLTYHV